MKKTTGPIIKWKKGEVFILTVIAFLLILTPVVIVYTSATLSSSNVKVEKLKEQIEKQQNINSSLSMQVDELASLSNIQNVAKEYGLSYNNNNVIDKINLNNSNSIYEYFLNEFRDKKQEYFYCIYVDTKGKYIDKKCLFIGTINNSVVHPREVFKEAYLLSASGIICIHNHPSGDVNPSREDKVITLKLKEIGLIHGIKIIDHIIIGSNSYFSFFDNDML